MTARQLAALAVGAAALVPEQLTHDGPALCPFRRLTGRPCPTCGMTRSWNATSRLDLRRALLLHPFGPPTFAAALAVAILPPDDLERIRPRLERWMAPLAVVWLAVWLIRLRRPA